MRYIKWNNIIANFLFNEEKCDKEVKLFITKNDILNLADENQIHNGWEDFVTSVTNGIGADNNSCFIKRFMEGYDKKEKPFLFCGKTVAYPPQIGLLSFLILPFTEIDNNDIHGSAYYPRINKFLSDNNIIYTVTGEDLKLIEVLWKDLEDWTFEQEGQFGIFMIPDLGFKYVGKLFAQCLIRPTESKMLPKLFADSGFLPYDKLPKKTIKKFVLKNLNKLKLTKYRQKIEDNHPLGMAYINFIKHQYEDWNGETEILENNLKSSKSGKVIIRALGQLKYVERTKKWISYIRLKSGLPYSENLSILNYEVFEIFNGYSNQVPIDHLETVPLIIKDKYNKVEIRYKKKSIKLFVKGSKFGLNNKIFLEVDYLNHVDEFLVIVANEKIQEFEEWALLNCSRIEKKDSYCSFLGSKLYKIYEPKESDNLLPELTFQSDDVKDVILEHGVKINARTFLTSAKPRIRVINATGLEHIRMEYDDKFTLELIQDIEHKDIWMFPDRCREESKFRLILEGQTQKKQYSFISPGAKIYYADYEDLPIRNRFGRIVSKMDGAYFKGNSIIDKEKELRWNTLNSYYYDFYKTFGTFSSSIDNYANTANEKFLYFLTEKGKLNYKSFSDAFDHYFGASEKKDTGLAKWLSIRYLEILGYIDFNRSKKIINVCRPQLILMPHNNMGYELLLTGGRSIKLIEQLIQVCRLNQFGFSSVNQKRNYFAYLIPNKISVKIGPSQLQILKKELPELNIIFENRIEQIAITHLFSGSLNKYRNSIEETEPLSNFTKYLFDTETLTYKSIENQDGIQNGLVKHELNSFTKFYIYWKDGIPREVNETWGKYLILNDINKTVVLFNAELKKVAIPVTCRLPQLFEKALALMSGLVPDNRFIKGKDYSGNYDVYENIPSVIAQNEFKNILEQHIQTDDKL